MELLDKITSSVEHVPRVSGNLHFMRQMGDPWEFLKWGLLGEEDSERKKINTCINNIMKVFAERHQECDPNLTSEEIDAENSKIAQFNLQNILTRELYLVIKTKKRPFFCAEPVEERFLNNNSRIFYE